MSSKIQFSYDQDTRKLIIDDDGVKHTWYLSDSKSEIFYYILKAIDLLDDNPSGPGTTNVAEWAKVGNTDKIPEDKYNIQHLEQEIVVKPTQVFDEAKEVETTDPSEDTKYVYVGGRA